MQRFRIVTFNIAHARGLSPFPGLNGRRRFERNLRKIARLFDELRPDVVALQEIDQNSRWSGSFDHLDYLRFF
ncbi:MAG TPA: endonuclease/exonuclease/phosphatase family protein, partial [Opitutaceae bacterium]|nr:endonuclease/exonuclease/phosphatase family protein [Opitutaceae bacterium]